MSYLTVIEELADRELDASCGDTSQWLAFVREAEARVSEPWSLIRKDINDVLVRRLRVANSREAAE